MIDESAACDRNRLGRRRFLVGAASAAGMLWLPACMGRWPGRDRPGWQQRADEALARGHEWLWHAQRDDGRFASATYGLLSSGQSLTPFALDSLLTGGRDRLAASDRGVDLALDAMLDMRDPAGALGFAEPGPDYPCYATGLMLSCLGAIRPPHWQVLARPSIEWLRGQQFRAAEGWAGHPAQGGWGMGTIEPRTPPHAGHVDLSMTRRVAQGLRAVDVSHDDPALLEARDFVLRCQSSDGSFVYSPVELALNKGLRSPDGSPLGYGSATSDALLCLDAVGLSSGPAFAHGHAWLVDHHRVDRNPGLEGGPMEPFAKAMRGYYRAGSGRCFALFGGPPGWRAELANAVVAEQAADGSVRNENPLQKEDDPIIGTGFAVQALAACLDGPG